MKDEQLATRAASGDDGAWSALVTRHQRRVRLWALAVVGDRSTAEDVCQDAWLRLMSNIGQFDSKRIFIPWLRAVVRNIALDHRKRKLAVPTPDLEVVAACHPERQLDAVRSLNRVHKAFERLTERQREAYMLAEIEGLSGVMAAEHMNISPGTFRALLHQARTQLRKAVLETQ